MSSRLREYGPPALLYLLLAVWLTWPQAALLGQAVVGGPIAEADGWQKVWNMWWFRTALMGFDDPLTTRLLFWPQGASLGFQPIDISNALLALPVLLAVGPLWGYGVAAILGFALSGLATYALALRMSGSHAGALVAGVIAAAAPSHLVRFLDGQLEHVALHWTALALLALHNADERATLRSGAWLGLALAPVAYTSWYHALFCALMAAIWIGWRSIAQRDMRRLVRPWITALPLLLLLIAPLLASFAGGLQQSGRDAAHWRTQAALYSADLVDFLLPSAHHPLWGAPVAAYQQALHPASAGWVVTPGYLAILLAGAGLMLAWRSARLWGALALALILFALGETLQIAGSDTGLPLPIASLFAALPGLNFGHRRFIAATIALVPLAVTAAFGVRELLRIAYSVVHVEYSEEGKHKKNTHYALRSTHYVLPALLIGILLLEYAPPQMLVFRDDTAPLYASLRGGDGALLIIPIDPGGLRYKSASLRAQMTHGRPIAGGYVAREPDYPLARGAPLIGRIEREGCEPPGILADDPATAAAALGYYGFTQIVVDDAQLSAQQAACVRETLAEYGAPLLNREGAVAIYAAPQAAPKPFIYIGDGWGPVERDGDRLWRWIGADATLVLVNTDTIPRQFAVTIRGQSYLGPRPLTLSAGAHTLGAVQVAPTISRAYTVLISATPGETRIRLTAPTDADQTRDGVRQISISIEQVSVRPLPPSP